MSTEDGVVSSGDILLPKWARLQVFYHRLRTAVAASTHEGSLQLIAEILHAVEDEFSGVLYDPAETGIDGRMYPPNSKFRRPNRDIPGVVCYRQFSHITFIGDNGAFEIRVLETQDGRTVEYTEVDMPGSDGRRLEDYGTV